MGPERLSMGLLHPRLLIRLQPIRRRQPNPEQELELLPRGLPGRRQSRGPGQPDIRVDRRLGQPKRERWRDGNQMALRGPGGEPDLRFRVAGVQERRLHQAPSR